MELSKDADKMIGVLYKAYLEKRKNGESKAQAKIFSENWCKEYFPDQLEADVFDTLREIKASFNLKIYVTGGFLLSDEAIIYMENRFPEGVKSVLSFLAQFIP